MRNLIETSDFTPAVSVVENGDQATAENFNPAPQALANRTLFLKDAHDALQAELAARFANPGQVTLPAASQTVRYIGPRGLVGGGNLFPFDSSWALLDDGWLSRVNRARLYVDLTPHLGRWEWLLRLWVAVVPGTARPTASDRISVQLKRVNYGPGMHVLTVTPTVIGTETDDGTTTPQWIPFDFASSPIPVSDGATWELRIITGADSETSGNPDAIYAVAYEVGFDRLTSF